MIFLEELFEWERIDNVPASSLRWLQGLGVPSFLAIVLGRGECVPGKSPQPACLAMDPAISLTSCPGKESGPQGKLCCALES